MHRIDNPRWVRLFLAKSSGFFWQFLFLLLLHFNVAAGEKQSFVAIIIDDMGDNLIRGERALHLPGALTFSLLPHTPYAKTLALTAHEFGREIMLHMPMQPESDKNMGPGGLTQTMDEYRFLEALKTNLQAIPYVVGVNNHMGSLLTQRIRQMKWVMQGLQAMGDYYFVDSLTHKKSVAQKMAAESYIPNTSRDIFLDHEISVFAIDKQFILLMEKARQTGFALAIGHPHNETLLALEYWIPQLIKHGIELVPVSQYIKLKDQRSHLWHASLFPSHKAVKN